MATLLLILQLLPSIMKIVKDIEDIFKGTSITNLAKKQVLLDAIAGSDAKTVAVASSLADRVVGSFNKTGFFTHGSDLPPAPVQPPT